MIRVLSLRGGGIRGIATAILLEAVEKTTKRPICETFDLIVGTSVGAIMAIALALKIPATDLVDFFVTEGPLIFRSRKFFRIAQMLGHPRFDVQNLRAAISRHYMPEALLAHTFTKVMVTSTRYRGLESRFWKSWKHTELSAVDAASSSAAALTYFAPVNIGDFDHGDGGMFANNPVDCAVIEAHKLWPAHHLAVIDIACPNNKLDFEPRGGIIEAAPHIANIFIGSGEDAATYKAKYLIQNGRLLTIEPPLLDADRDIGDASERNLKELRKCAEWRLERNVDDIVRAITTNGR